MKQILVTGGAGYIGSHTLIELSKAGYEFVVFDDFSNSSPEALKRVEEITQKSFTCREGDIRDRSALEKIFEEFDIDSVINFAGVKAVGESVANPLKYYDINVGGTVNLLQVMKKYGCKKFVFSSSATVYGDPASTPIDESFPVGAVANPYGRSKFIVEQILQDLPKGEIEFVILRYFNPIGVHESGLIGEDPNDIPNNLMPYITQTAVGKREFLSVFGSDYDTHDGTGVRDYLHVVDLAVAHVKAIEYLGQNSKPLVVNLGTGKGYSVLDVVKAFEKMNGVKVPYRLVGRRDGDVAKCYADATLAQNVLKWRAEKSLEDMCRDSWNWQKNNPNGYKK